MSLISERVSPVTFLIGAFSKLELSIAVDLLRNVMAVMLSQPKNVPLRIPFNPLPIVIDFSLEQYSKAFLPIFVTPLPIDIDERL